MYVAAMQQAVRRHYSSARVAATRWTARRRLSATAAGDSGRSERPPWLWRRFHGLFDFEVPLSSPLPYVAAPKAANVVPHPKGARVTQLDNGVRVVTPANASTRAHSANDLITCFGVFVNAGSRHEMRETSGSTHLLEALAFRTATLERSAWRLARGIEDTGGSVACTAGRESIAYTGECMRDQAPALFRLVGEAALQPQFLGYGEGVVADDDDIRAQVRETLHLLEREIREVHDKDAQTQVTEALHAAAYEGNTLGLPLLMNEQRIKTITPEAVKAFWESRLSRPADVVVSAVGIGHDELVSLVEQQTGHLPLRHELAADTAIEPARYTGGESRLTGDGLAQLAFGAEGVSWSDPDLVPICVLHTLMGGGGSFSAGGPGKGMYSRLYTNILNHHPWVHSCSGFNHCYTDSGLFGIHATADADRLPDLAEVVCEEFSKIGHVSKAELARAKNQTKASLLMNLEHRAVACEDLGRQVLTSGVYIEPTALYTAVEGVTEKDIERVASRVAASKPAVVLYGEMYHTPSYDQLIEAAGVKLLRASASA